VTPLFRPVAEACVLVDFAAAPSPAVEAAVHSLDRALADHPFPGFAEAIPAFVTLAVVFDPLQTDHAAVTRHLQSLLAYPPAVRAPWRQHQVEVSYDPAVAPDLPEVARKTGLTPDQVIAAHLSADYHVVMYGFAPGYAYLGGLPEALKLDRKPSPVRNVPVGSVIIAGGQCLITTLTMPTGWWVIGHSPTKVLTGDPARPFLFDVGDHVRFHRLPDLHRSPGPGHD
jgi:inhibitor of KinA